MAELGDRSDLKPPTPLFTLLAERETGLWRPSALDRVCFPPGGKSSARFQICCVLPGSDILCGNYNHGYCTASYLKERGPEMFGSAIAAISTHHSRAQRSAAWP